MLTASSPKLSKTTGRHSVLSKLPIQKLSLAEALESLRIDLDGIIEDLDAEDITEYADALIAMLQEHYGGK